MIHPTSTYAERKPPTHPPRLTLQDKPGPQPLGRALPQERRHAEQQELTRPTHRQGCPAKHHPLQQLDDHAANQDTIDQYVVPVER